MKRPYEAVEDSFPPTKRIKFVDTKLIDWQDYYIG